MLLRHDGNEMKMVNVKPGVEVKDYVFSVSDTGILGLKEKSDCSQQESNL